MLHKDIRFAIFLVFTALLAACSGFSLPNLTAAATNSSQVSTTSSVESILAPGILRLEGTDMAISSAQAVELLPVWKAVRVMSADKSASAIEVAALYSQTLQVLTLAQAQAIQDMSWAENEIAGLTQQFNAQVTQTGSLTSASTKSQTLSSSGAAGGGPGGGFGPGGFGGPNGLDAQINTVSSTTSQTNTSSAKSSSSAVRPSSSAAKIGLNALFSDNVVALLQQRAGL